MFSKLTAFVLFVALMTSEISHTMKNDNHKELDQKLREAVINNDIKNVTFYLENSANPNNQDESWKWTCLIGACSIAQPNKNIIRLLLVHKANPNIQSRYGITALMLICNIEVSGKTKPDTEILNLLLEYKANPNIIDEVYGTPLHCIGYYPNKEVIEILLSSKADPNIQDREGQIPLHLVTREKKYCTHNKKIFMYTNSYWEYKDFETNPELVEIVKLFLKYGTDYRIQDNLSYTSLTHTQRMHLGLYEDPQDISDDTDDINEELQSLTLQPKPFCSSIFHTNKIKQWCDNKTICPQCNTIIKEEK